MLIGAADVVVAGKSADQHQQGGFGQVEVGEKGIDDAEAVAGGDKEAGVAGVWRKIAARRCAFQGAQGGGADGDNAATAGAAGGDGIYHVFADGEPFFVHDVLGEVFVAHRLEGARADVQGDFGALHAARGDGSEQGFIEMQAGGRGGDGAAVFGVHGLVALAVAVLCAAFEVGRDRHFAVRGEEFLPRRAVAIQGKKGVITVADAEGGVADVEGAARLRVF